MTTIKTNELTGAALDWAVAKCEGALEPLGNVRVVEGKYLLICVGGDPEHGDSRVYFQPSTDWVQGGPIIEREGIELQCNISARQAAAFKNAHPDWFACLKFKRADHWHGHTPLIAAMRCYCCAKLGEEIEIPQELQICQP